jgi:hypothetical protein
MMPAAIISVSAVTIAARTMTFRFKRLLLILYLTRQAAPPAAREPRSLRVIASGL